MNVNPGELKRKIEIIMRESNPDSDGYGTRCVEKVIHQCHAKFSRTSGTEIQKADTDFSEIKARFLIRYTQTPIDRRMFVRYRQELYEIVYLNDYGDEHEYIEIWCKKLSMED